MLRQVFTVASRRQQSTRLRKLRIKSPQPRFFSSSDASRVPPFKSIADDDDHPTYEYFARADEIDPKNFQQKSMFKAKQSVPYQRSFEAELKKRGDGRVGRQQRHLTTTTTTTTKTKTKKRRIANNSVQIKVKVPHHSKEFDLKWKLGESLVALAADNEDELGEYIEGACGQTMSCCTCHVYIENEEFRTILPEPDESELDMLDLAYDPKDSSRLGCQVKLTPDLISANISLYEIAIPSGVNNHWT